MTYNLSGIEPFVWLGNIFGIFSCKLVGNSFESRGLIIRCYVIILFLVRALFGVAWIVAQLSEPQDRVTPISLLTIYATQLLALLGHFFTALFFDKRHVELFAKLEIYDERVAKLGHPRKDRYTIYWLFIGLTIVFVATALEDPALGLSEISSIEAVVTVMYLFFLPVTRILCVFKYDLFIDLVCRRFRHFNESIMPSVAWTRRRDDYSSIASINDVMFLHSTLLDASGIINKTYTLTILAWFTNLFVSTAYYIYVAPTFTFRTMFPYHGSTFLLLTTTCAICNITAREANSAGNKMSKDQPTLIDDSTSMDRVRMQLYFVHNRLVFSAADLFVIDLSLFYSMMVAIATYSVIITKIFDA